MVEAPLAASGNGVALDGFAEWPSERLVETAEAFVRSHLSENNFDSSHDWWHIDRVRKLSKMLLQKEDPSVAEEVLRAAELCALLHDVADWKYSGCDKAGVSTVTRFLDEHKAGPRLVGLVAYVVQNIGFKESLGCAAPSEPPHPVGRLLLHIVQDADRLDAIGAIGIARCLTFGGHFKRTLHDPAIKPRDALDKAAYMSATAQQTTINHFYEKLLKLETLMNTRAARALAARRTRTMQAFLSDFYAEWDLTDLEGMASA